jgi:hypothetical protein
MDAILFHPHLLPELKNVSARLRSGKHWIELNIHNDGRRIRQVMVNGQAWGGFTSDEVRLALPEQDTTVVIWLSDA